MNAADLVSSLEDSGRAIVAFFEGLDETAARWRPSPGRWSLLEVLGHLCDEERDDFRRRVASTLADPTVAWPPIDPEGWVTAHDYQARTLAEALADFRAERESSLAWLSGLRAPEWDRTHEHPKIGALSAGDLLASWAAHDLAHLRQMGNVRLAWVQHVAKPFTTDYAGA